MLGVDVWSVVWHWEVGAWGEGMGVGGGGGGDRCCRVGSEGVLDGCGGCGWDWFRCWLGLSEGVWFSVGVWGGGGEGGRGCGLGIWRRVGCCKRG